MQAMQEVQVLSKAIAKNPVMLLYLNNAQSRKEHPNQNWARELLELYTVGPGHYTEQDILEAARAFTGWTVRLPGNQRPREASANLAFEYVFNRNWHDPGEKTFLGKRVKSGDEVLEILIAHSKTYEFVARKLLRFYLCPEPPKPWCSKGRRSSAPRAPVAFCAGSSPARFSTAPSTATPWSKAHWSTWWGCGMPRGWKR